ncbi:MAG: histidine kinase, partial [Anaerolineae bacterium]|nr:histidine kinase [Anaerolineae bacterium]
RLEAVEERAGIDARLLVEGDVDLPASLEERLYRIAQEALNNALKHSAGTSVAVRIHVNDERLELEVVDDGVGFDIDGVSDTGGLGLAMMRERAAELGGLLLISSAPGQGTTVKISKEKRPRRRPGDLP